MRRNELKSSRGFTLVEIAMVLSIAALLIAGVMYFYNSASQANQTNDALQEMATIEQAVHSMYQGNNFLGLQTSVIAQSKLLPNKWVSGTGLSSPFSEQVLVEIAVDPVPNKFIIQFWGIPDAACSKMVTMDFGKSLIEVDVYNASPVPGRAMTPLEANRACVGGNRGYRNIITWKFN